MRKHRAEFDSLKLQLKTLEKLHGYNFSSVEKKNSFLCGVGLILRVKRVKRERER